jgi:hypothetical protein
MQPRLITQSSDGTSLIMGKSMTLPESWWIRHVAIQSGRGEGARFMKKNSPAAPCGYRFMTMARSRMCGSRSGATSA